MKYTNFTALAAESSNKKMAIKPSFLITPQN